jgi:peptidoglycan/LPS O-acetylase OafA/YrhL
MPINRKENNFGIIRILFAVSIALIHCSILAELNVLSKITYFFTSETRVNAFFVMSGLLVYMSYQNKKHLLNYFNRRIRRILPGYSMVILICAFLFYFISNNTFQDYFNIHLLKYIFANLLTLNFIEPNLPGVFQSNPVQAVNVSLWTIKIEIMFYFCVPLISLLIKKIGSKRALLSIYFTSIAYNTSCSLFYEQTNNHFFLILRRQIPGEMVYFISGITLYYYFERLVKHRQILFLTALSVLLVHQYLFEVYVLYPISLAIVVIYFATQIKYLGKINNLANYSLGFYIWHAPIIQLFYSLGLFKSPAIGVCLFLTATSLMAYISWNFIEKPFLYKSSHYKSPEKLS